MNKIRFIKGTPGDLTSLSIGLTNVLDVDSLSLASSRFLNRGLAREMEPEFFEHQ